MTQSRPVNYRYRPDIDGLRAVAVISVLLFHLGVSLFAGGFVGVDIFFVISGFLITGIIKNEIEATGRFRFGAFYLRRIRRLFPALFATLFLTSVAAVLLLSPVHLKSFGGSLASALASVANMFFWKEADYFDVSARVKPLLHTWSLSIEEQFYIFWPVLLLFLLRVRAASFAPFLVVSIGAISLAANIPFGAGAGGAWNEDGRSTIFYLLPFRVFEFTIGGSLVWFESHRLKNLRIYELLFWTGLLLMAYAVLQFDSAMLFPSYHALVPCIGAALIIYAGDKAASGWLISNPPVVWIGLISYSLYLIHWPVIVFWQYLGGEPGWEARIFAAALSFLLACASYRYIEQPYRTKKIDIAAPAWRYAAIAGSVAMIAAGLHMNFKDGWAWRAPVPPVVFEYVGDAASFHRKFYGGAGYPSYGPVETSKRADIVVMGDSHARHYAEGVFKVFAEPGGLALYISAGTSCFHLPGFTRATEGHDWDRICPEKLNQALEFIDRGNAPLIIVSHSWISQMSRGRLLDVQGRRSDRELEQKDIISGLFALKERIGNSPLLVIGEAPRTGDNLYDIFTRPRPPFLPALDIQKYLYSQQRPEAVAFNAALRTASRQSDKFVFLDPHDALCNNGICRNTNGQNQLLYSDIGHLSKYGSIEVVQGLLSELQAANRMRGAKP